jgi:diguanylate cyclase (GGDEF)-like protein
MGQGGDPETKEYDSGRTRTSGPGPAFMTRDAMIWQGGTTKPRAKLRMRFSHSHVLTTRLCGIFALALGAMVLAGWALGIPVIVRFRPEWTPMVVNTAIGFLLGGAGLLVAVQCRRWCARIAVLLGILLILLAVEELCVLVFDLAPALSLPDLHRPLQPGFPHPGRMAPNTAVCFLLFGTGLLGVPQVQRASILKWVQWAAIAVLAIGLLGVIGYSLQLEYLYGWTGVVRMAVPTGVGMLVLGIGLWNLARARAGALPISDGEEVAGVYRAATALLLLIAASAGIGGFAFLQNQLERQVRENLQHMTADRIALLQQILADRSGRAKAASDDDDLTGQLRKLAMAPQDPTMLAALRARAGRLHANGFSSITAVAGGRRWQLVGDPMRPALAVPLHGKDPGWLLWRDGYVLRRAMALRDDAGVVGTLVTEQPLQPLSVMSAAANQLGDSGEMALCATGAEANTMRCFPLRSRPQPSSLVRVVAGLARPMDYALRGKTGTVIAFDYRQHRVLAAYGPVGDTGLGLLVKRDIAEIYAPIRLQFQRIVLFLVALLLFGLWLLRRRLRPLLHALENSRAQARADSARFEAAVESNLDAFFILECIRDANGAVLDMRFMLLNAPAERVLGRSRAETIGHGMCELLPELRPMLDTYLRVVETGEPVVVETKAIIREMRWYQLQAVKLGDGVGVTMRDITDARHDAEQIRHQAAHDPLTGVANRAGFELAFTAAIADAQERGHVVALALLDLDDFKRINDNLGHAAGDHLLQVVATRLRACMRPSDTVARLGGDEFVLVMPNIRYPDGVVVVANKVIEQVVQPLRVDGHDIAVTVSIGISAFPNDGMDAASLLKSADLAMYRAKRAGRNGYVLHGATPG